MKTSNSYRAIFALILTLSSSAFVPSSQLGGTCSVRTFGGVCKSRWGTSLQETSTSGGTDQRRPKPNNPRNRSSNSNNSSFRRTSNYRNGPGGGGQAALKLENPLRVQRVAAPPPPPRERRERSDGPGGGNSRGPDRNSRPNASGPSGSDGGRPQKTFNNAAAGTGTGGGAADGRGRKRVPGKKAYDGGGVAARPPRKTSLRLGTGKRGRAANLSSRRGSLKKRDRTSEKEARAFAAEERKTVSLPDGPVTVSELADIIDEKPVAIIKLLMIDLGVMASMTQSLDPATCAAVVEGFGKIVGGEDDEDWDDEDMDHEDSALSLGFVSDDDDPDLLEYRAPVVTIMGHVDHGKTSLLDAIRDTAVTAGEAGGITQHIAAYQVKHKDQEITFIDTPGHAAFTDMRERGANITDIVILVVAADDGVKQQTADSIACARQAGVPLVIAINKCDLETADPMKVMTELTGYDILTEEFGGEVLSSQISAKEGTNLNDLMDKVMLQAEIQNLKANPDRNAEAIVVEAKVEKGLGTVATSLVKRGTLRVGDVFAAGETYGKVRALFDTSDGKTRLEFAGPSQPVRIVGFEGIPAAGDSLVVVDDEQAARALAESRKRISREKSSSSYQDGLMDSVTLAFGSTKAAREMCVVVKADVQGSAEALTRSLRELRLENEEAVVTVKVLVSEAGEVSKSDIAIASVTQDTTVIAFNCAASFAAMEDARIQNIPIEYYSIVYDAIESVESRMQEVLSPTPEGEYSGSAVVQEVFNIGGTGNIAGSKCQDGILKKGSNVRVMRGDKILIESRIKTLRNFKAEVDTLEAGNECGIGLIDFETFEPGDVVECYVE